MDYAVRVGNRAERSLEGIPAADRRKIMLAIDAMRTAPLAGDVVKLKGQAGFRRRVGRYRIIFLIDFARLSVDIVDVLRRTTTTYR